jgi:ribosome recycling factor
VSPSQLVVDTTKKLNAAVEHFKDELKKLRTGRAHPNMLDSVIVEAYGSQMPLNQVGNVTAPDATLIQITPFDPGNLNAISDAIRNNQSLGLNPMDDGHVVRVPIPPLTEERRKEISKQVSVKHEDCMISMRNIRHEALEEVDSAKKDKEIGEDEAKRLSSQIEDAINKTKSEAESISKEKEQEIMKV